MMVNVIVKSFETIIKKISDCALVRVYLIDEVRRVASLEYVVKKSIDGKIYAYNLFVDSDFGLIEIVPINLRRFFLRNNIESRSCDYFDLVCRFNDYKTFVVDYRDMINIPNKVMEFLQKNYISSSICSRIMIDDPVLYGYVSVDMQNTPSHQDIEVVDDVVSISSYDFFNYFEDCKRNYQQDKKDILIRSLSAEYERININNNKYNDIFVFLKKLMSGIFEICSSINLIEVMAVESENVKKILYVDYSPFSEINNDDRDKLLGVIGTKVHVDHRVNNKVTGKSIYVPDAQRYRNAKIFNEKKRGVYDTYLEMRYSNCSEIIVPIEYCGNVFGLLSAYGRRPYSLNKRVLEILESMTPYIGMAILAIKESEKCELIENDRSGVMGEHVMASLINVFRRVFRDRILDR